VGLRHHVVPLPVEQVLVEATGQLGVVCEEFAHPVGVVVGRDGSAFRVVGVFAGGDIHLEQVGGGLDGVEDELDEGGAPLGGQALVEGTGGGGQPVVVLDHAVGLAVVGDAVGVGRQHLMGAARVVFRVEGEHLGDGRGVLLAELLRGPARVVAGQVVGADGLGIPGEVEEEAHGKLHRLDVADVDDPQVAHAGLVGERHLLPDALDLADVEPSVGDGGADVVDVVIHAVAAGTFQVLGAGEVADVAPVVVGEEDEDVVIHPHPLVVVVLDLLVERPDLGDRGGGFAEDLGEDGALVADDFLEQGHGGVFGHGLVAVAAHADGDEALEAAHAFDAAAPEFAEFIAVGLVVPGAAAEAFPFVVGAHHGLVVAGAHDDPVFVGETRVAGVVGVEGDGQPHGRPEVVGLAAKEELEDVGVEGLVEAAEVLACPVAQGGGLVVDEDAAIFHLGFARGVAAGGDVESFTPGRGHVGPEMPGGDADLARELVDAVDRTAFVAADDHERLVVVGGGVIQGGDDEALPFAGEVGDVDPAGGDEGVDQRAATEGADKDGATAIGLGRRGADAGEVGAEIAGGADHPGEVGGIGDDRGGGDGVEEGERAGGRGGLDDDGREDIEVERVRGGEDSRSEQDQGGEQQRTQEAENHRGRRVIVVEAGRSSAPETVRRRSALAPGWKRTMARARPLKASR